MLRRDSPEEDDVSMGFHSIRARLGPAKREG
jgi:hypothetical protein